jgi:hypothetical protein
MHILNYMIEFIYPSMYIFIRAALILHLLVQMYVCLTWHFKKVVKMADVSRHIAEIYNSLSHLSHQHYIS